ncbi:hypothetical protein DFH06DRAFT_1316364 [Mycena polygramma]|nr:hypothetical protein DFH06DRAFT_1316364 [Mycena polygramma]
MEFAKSIHDPNDCDGEDISGSHRLDVEIFTPSRAWNIVMFVQFTLLFILGSFSLYEVTKYWRWILLWRLSPSLVDSMVNSSAYGLHEDSFLENIPDGSTTPGVWYDSGWLAAAGPPMSESTSYDVSPEIKWVVELSTALDAAKSRIAELENERCAELLELNNNLKIENGALKAQCAKQTPGSQSALQREYDALQQRYGELQTRPETPHYTDLRRRNNELTLANVEMRQHIEELQSRCAALQKGPTADAIQKSNRSLKIDNKALTKKIAELEEKVKALPPKVPEPPPSKGVKRTRGSSERSPSVECSSTKRRRSTARRQRSRPTTATSFIPTHKADMGSFLARMSPPSFRPERDMPDLSGKIIIVTGGNTGIGYETVKQLLPKNAKVYLAARSPEKAAAAIKRLEGETKKTAMFLQLDLADLPSVRKAAETFLGQESKLDILVNNGGIMISPPEMLTAQNHDLQFGTNVIGHFFFTELLLPALTKSYEERKVPARVINTSSYGHIFAPGTGMEFESLKGGPQRDAWVKQKGSFKAPWALYGESKMGNLFISNYFAKAHKDVLVSCGLHPDGIKTELQRRQNTSRMGALTQLWAATVATPEQITGQYLMPRGKVSKADNRVANRKLEDVVIAYLREQIKGF